MNYFYHRPAPPGREPLHRSVVAVVIITLVLLAGTFEFLID